MFDSFDTQVSYEEFEMYINFCEFIHREYADMPEVGEILIEAAWQGITYKVCKS